MLIRFVFPVLIKDFPLENTSAKVNAWVTEGIRINIMQMIITILITNFALIFILHNSPYFITILVIIISYFFPQFNKKTLISTFILKILFFCNTTVIPLTFSHKKILWYRLFCLYQSIIIYLKSMPKFCLISSYKCGNYF